MIVSSGGGSRWLFHTDDDGLWAKWTAIRGLPHTMIRIKGVRDQASQDPPEVVGITGIPLILPRGMISWPIGEEPGIAGARLILGAHWDHLLDAVIDEHSEWKAKGYGWFH